MKKVRKALQNIVSFIWLIYKNMLWGQSKGVVVLFVILAVVLGYIIPATFGVIGIFLFGVWFFIVPYLIYRQDVKGNPSKNEDAGGLKITISVGRKFVNRFRTLMGYCGADSPRQVALDALRMYEYLVLEERMGTKFYVKDKETGELVPHVFFKNNKEGDEEDD